MIKLNVLDEPDNTIPKKRAIFVLSCVTGTICAFVAVTVWFSLSYMSAQMQRDVDIVEKSINHLRSKNRESVEIESTVAKLSKLAEEISTIKLNQVGVAQLMVDLSRKIPEKVWLISLDKKGSEIILDGYAITDFDLASFQRALETLPYMKSVELVRSVTVYLNKMFAFDSISNEVLMQIIDTKNQDKFSNFIHTRAQSRNMRVINGPPPAGTLQRDPTETDKTSLGWKRTEKAAPPGFYIWSKGEVMEAKQFSLNLTLDFSRLPNIDQTTDTSLEIQTKEHTGQT